MDKAVKPVRLGFELDCLQVPLELLHPGRVMPATIKNGVKYKQVKSSIEAIGLVEPLAIIPHTEHQGAFQVLDGHIRLMAMAELGMADALCLVRISAHRGRRFRLIVDGVSAGSWTAFQSDRGRRFSEIVDDRGCAQVIH